MNNIIKAAFVAICVLVVLSCTKQKMDSLEERNQEHSYTFSINNDKTFTKTTIGTDCIEWKSGDAIGVYSVALSGTSVNQSAAVTVATPCTINVKSTYALTSGDKIYCYYPYSSTNSSNSVSTVALSIPIVQNVKSGVFDADAMPMVSVPYTATSSIEADTQTAAGQIDFCYLGSVLEFNVYSSTTAFASEKVNEVTFISNDAIAGDFTINLSAVDPSSSSTLAIAGYSEKQISVTGANLTVGATKAANTAVIPMVIAPGTHSGLLKVYTDKAQYTYTITNSVSSRAGKKIFNVNLTNGTRKTCVTICGVHWALGNLLYDSSASVTGFQNGWKISDNQWFYYNYNQATAYNSNSKAYNGTNLRTDVAHSSTGYDHFNFGGIDNSFTNLSTACISISTGLDIGGKMYTDSDCGTQTADFSSAKFGDLAYWASYGQYRMPTGTQLKTLRDNASISFGYYKPGETVNGIDLKVWGLLFTNNDGTQVTDFTEKEFSTSDLNTGLFLPLAGRRADSSDAQIISTRMEGEYWSSNAQDKSSNETSNVWTSSYKYSTLLKIQYTGTISYGFTIGERYDRQSGFCIRPVID